MKINHTEVRSFFYGCLLGDGDIHNHRFCSHQISKDLIDFKANFIKRYLPNCAVYINEEPEYTDKKGVHHKKAYKLIAGPHPYINKLEKLFYHNGKKIYPLNTVKKLTNLGYAMWYADDGTTVLVQKGLGTDGGAKNRRIQFCTDNFTYEEHLKIKQELEITKHFETKIINRCRNNQYRIQISVKDGQQLISLIYTYFYDYFPSLLYKMDLGYRGKGLQKRGFVSETYNNIFIKISAHPLFFDRIKEDIVQTTTQQCGLGN